MDKETERTLLVAITKLLSYVSGNTRKECIPRELYDLDRLYTYFDNKIKNTDEIKIKYDGAYPNLCRGNLIVYIGEQEYKFPEYCLESGGEVTFDDNWSEEITAGPWSITEYPQDFPEEYKEKLLEIINDEIEWGCCGGCV